MEPGVKDTLFMFAQVNPLDNVRLDSIQSVEIVGDRINFNIVNQRGEKEVLHKPNTKYIMDQIEGYNLPKQ